MTSTSSMIVWSIAARIAEPVQDSPGQTSYEMMFACGATPEMVTVSLIVGPFTVASTTLPAVVDAVCEP